MKVDDTSTQPEMAQRLKQALAQLGLHLPDVAQQRLVQYVLELSKWNRTYNLTAVRDVDQMLVQHVFDCLALLPSIKAYETDRSTHFDRIADIGSGAGLPAVVIAICRPQTKVISVDAVEKKSAFVRHVANTLGLVNLSALHQRVEQVNSPLVDMVVSRAFASLAKFVGLAQAMVAPGGVIAAMKSKMLDEECKELEHSGLPWVVDRIDSVRVPELDATRAVAWLKRK